MEQFRKKFQHFDTDRSGTLGGSEIFKALEELTPFRMDVRSPASLMGNMEILDMLESVAKPGTEGLIDFQGFLQFVRFVEEMRVQPLSKN